MKRMNVLVEESALEEVKKRLKTESYSATINAALREMLRLTSIKEFSMFAGSGIWEGNLSEMRDDKKNRVRKKKRK